MGEFSSNYIAPSMNKSLNSFVQISMLKGMLDNLHTKHNYGHGGEIDVLSGKTVNPKDLPQPVQPMPSSPIAVPNDPWKEDREAQKYEKKTLPPHSGDGWGLADDIRGNLTDEQEMDDANNDPNNGLAPEFRTKTVQSDPKQSQRIQSFPGNLYPSNPSMVPSTPAPQVYNPNVKPSNVDILPGLRAMIESAKVGQAGK